jgi:uncharacterized membrane protein YhaH (DUF805 family)
MVMGWVNLKYLLTDLDGRISRRPYWMGIVPLVVIGVALYLVGYGAAGETLAVILSLIVLYPSFALNVKRAHDRNRPTWVVVALFIMLIAIYVLQLLGLSQTADGPTTLYLAVLIPCLLLALYLLVEFGCLRGTVGPNQYGSDPLEGRG